jgi:type I restriction enzyme M protein
MEVGKYAFWQRRPSTLTGREMNLSSAIKSIQDIMRKDDGIDGDAQRIGQLTWMLFLKVFDQREDDWQRNAEIRGEIFVSPLPSRFRWRNWAAFKKGKSESAPSDLIAFVNNELFPELKNLKVGKSPVRRVIRQVFEDSNNYMKSGSLMLGVIEKLNEAINFHDFTTQQNLGDIYEQILNDLRAAGNAGEFYTPRALTQVMVELINPQLGETVMDPACGTGGFLTATLDFLRQQAGAHKNIIEQSIKGVEKKQLPHLLCTTNLLLHGVDVPSQVDHSNTLARPWNSWRSEERVDCVITNPPFGGLEDEDVGSDYPADTRTRETADMFLTLIVKKLLKRNGRAAVVLPDGALFGQGVKARVKKMLMDECNLHTIIRLPNGVFAPYTNIKTNLLFFTKGKPTETIWYYEHPYPEGRKSYSKTNPIRLQEFDAVKAWWGSEANYFVDRVESERAWKIDFRTMKVEAEAQAIPYWERARELNAQASQLEKRVRELRASVLGVKDLDLRAPTDVQIESLRDQLRSIRREARDVQAAGDRLFWPIYNLDLKNPTAPEEESDNPDMLLERFKRLLIEIEDTREQLRHELGAALAHHVDRGAA